MIRTRRYETRNLDGRKVVRLRFDAVVDGRVVAYGLAKRSDAEALLAR